MRERAGTEPEDLIALIGPGVQVCCDEVGVQKPGTEPREGGTVQRALAAINHEDPKRRYLPGTVLRVRRGLDGTNRYHFDSLEAMRHQLAEAGVGRVAASSECTAQTVEKGGHLPDNLRRWPSLRKSDENNEDRMVAPDGSEIRIPKERRADRVTRYPVLAGLVERS